ncbi:apolipo protein O-domain-containing protein [Mycena latifolia]|nr:apolipo protein O-domain-containing protein [Mycena latifolia]
MSCIPGGALCGAFGAYQTTSWFLFHPFAPIPYEVDLYGATFLRFLATIHKEAALTRLTQLSIYAAPPEDVLLLDTPSALEVHIGTARRAATNRYREAHAHVQGLVSRWIGVENRVEHRIKALLPPDERLVPGALYAAIAFLAGSILARRRSLPLRFIAPPALGLGAAAYFLPRTSANVRAYLSDLEDHYTPELARVHETGKAHTLMTYERVRESAAGARAKAGEGVMKAVEGLQGATGLRLREALGVAQGVEERAERAVEEKIQDVLGAAKSVEEKAEKKAEEAAKERVV